LGEFSPIGWLFSLGGFCENYTVTDMYTFLTKNELGYLLGDFFKNASGHLVYNLLTRKRITGQQKFCLGPGLSRKASQVIKLECPVLSEWPETAAMAL
jgi:hypothetical protein